MENGIEGVEIKGRKVKKKSGVKRIKIGSRQGVEIEGRNQR